MKQPILALIGTLEGLGVRLKASFLRDYWWGRMFVDALLWPSDCRKAILHYRRVFGRRPNFVFPKTFNEFLLHRSLLSRHRRWAVLADKITVRDFVAQRIGEEHLIPLLWTGTDLSEAATRNLKFPFVVKANHISGDVLLARDESSFDWEAARIRANGWLASDYSLKVGEWQYRWIQPKLLIEEMLQDEKGMPPDDYKLFCFNGRVEIIQIDLNRFTNHTRSMRRRDFSPFPFDYCYPRDSREMAAPPCLGEMIRLAEALSRGERFFRTDFYIVGGKPVFGEVTLTPEAGLGAFDPPSWDQALWHLAAKGKNLKIAERVCES